MPLIWAVILVALWHDLGVLQAYLLAGQIPPANPLVYPSLMIFVLTLVPRLSLNIRRLHDIGRSAVWVIIPVVAVASVVAVCCALLGSFLNSGLMDKPDAPDDLANLIYPATLFLSSPDLFWQEMFTVAFVIDATGMDALNNLMLEVYSMNGAVDVRRSNINLRREIWGDLGHTYMMVVVMFVLTAIPMVSTFAHLFFLSFSSHMGANAYGRAKIQGRDEGFA